MGGALLQTVLVVEDDDTLRTTICLGLRRCGYRVLEAPDGEHAVALVASLDTPIDLLMSDVVMPGMDGPRVASTITRMRPTTRVLFTTGYFDNPSLLDAANRHEIHVLLKPFVLSSLCAEVERILTKE